MAHFGIAPTINIPTAPVTAINMCAFIDKFLAERPQIRHSRRHLNRGACGNRGMGAARTIADDPVVDRILPQVGSRARNLYRRRGGSAHPHATEGPQMDFSGKSPSEKLMCFYVKDGFVKTAPSVELKVVSRGVV